MYWFKAFYKGKTYDLQAGTSYEAQQKAATHFRAKKSHEVTVVRSDIPVDTASL